MFEKSRQKKSFAPEEIPAGFALTTLVVVHESETAELNLILPIKTLSDVEIEQKKKTAVDRALENYREGKRLKHELARLKLLADEEHIGACESENRDSESSEASVAESTSVNAVKVPVRPSIGELKIDEERLYLLSRAQSDVAERIFSFDKLAQEEGEKSQIYAPVYPPEKPLSLLVRKERTSDRDNHKRDRELYLKLAERSHLRKVGYPLGEHQRVLQDLQEIGHQMPHFQKVLDQVAQKLHLSYALQLPMKLPPIILYGLPGIGKTHFTHLLAKALHCPVRRQGCDSGFSYAALTGSDKHWGNSSTGCLFEMLVEGSSMSPVILLDEIDKSRPNSYGQDPLSALHTLLEPATSAAVRDISVDFEFDASHVVWIATANYPKSVPPTILSRFQEFHIEMPTGAQALQAASAVAKKVHSSMGNGIDLFDPVPSRIVVLIAPLSAREQIRGLESAFASAIADGRRVIRERDLPVDLDLDIPEKPPGGDLLH